MKKSKKKLKKIEFDWREDFIEFSMIPALLRRMRPDQIEALGLAQAMEDIPERFRGLRSQRDFAKKYGIDPSRLSQFKKTEKFINEINKRAKRIFKLSGTPNVYLGLYRAAVKGNPAAAKIYLQAIEDWVEKTKTEYEVPTTLIDIIKNAIKSEPEKE